MKGRQWFLTRWALSACLALASACNLSDSPTAPGADRSPLTPRFSFTGGSGTILGSTNLGELVEIDLTTGTVYLIGDGGTFDSKEVMWTDIAFDGAGNLFALSRRFMEPSLNTSRLYTVDPETGQVIQDVGDTGSPRRTDMDFDGTTMFVSARDLGCNCGRLMSINTSTAQATYIGDSTGFGSNPFLPDSLITPGGLAVHPITGDLWGIEATSPTSVIYRINPTTGVADSIVPLDVGSAIGFDALAILGDGTFIAARDAFFEESGLFVIDPTPNPESGLAAVTEIELDFDTPLEGRISGLEVVPEIEAPLTLSLSANETELHPWVPELEVNGLRQALQQGETSTITIGTAVNTVPTEVEVSVRAQFLNGSGGHAHITSRVAFDDVLTTQNGVANFGDLVGLPWAGFFERSGSAVTSLQAITVGGQLTFAFVAGVMGGEIDVIVETEFGGTLYADTVHLVVRVPGLLNARDSVTEVLFVGGTPLSGGPAIHPQGTNFYVTPSVAARMQAIATAMRDAALGDFYLQHNDASLEWGGSFSVNPSAPGVGERPLAGHLSHALGVDVDVAWCYALVAGFTATQDGRVRGTICSESASVSLADVVFYADQFEACAEPHPSREGEQDDHYHIRFTGRCEP